MRRVYERYAGATSYSDTGTALVTVAYPNATKNKSWRVRFTTSFDRRKGAFLFDVTAGVYRAVIWRQTDGEVQVWRAHDSLLSRTGVDQAVERMGGDSGTASLRVPRLLFGKPTRALEDASFRLDAEDASCVAPCFKLVSTSGSSNLQLWVRKQDHAVVRMKVQHRIEMNQSDYLAAIEFEPHFDMPLDSQRFAFVPPSVLPR